MRNVASINVKAGVSLIAGIAENKTQVFAVGTYFTGDTDIGIYRNLIQHWSKNPYVDVYNLCDTKDALFGIKKCILKSLAMLVL